LHLENAYLAVDFFFILSGFVVAYAYEQKITEGMRWGQFLRVRVIRLYPVILFAGVVGALSAIIAQMGPNVLWSSVFTAFGLPTPSGLVEQPFIVNGPVWSLFFEVVVNFLYFGVIVSTGKRFQLGAFFIMGIAWCWMIYFHGIKVGFTYETLSWGLVRAAFPFGIGVLLHRSLSGVSLSINMRAFVPLMLALVLLLAAPSSRYFNHSIYAVLCIAILFPIVIVLGALVDVPTHWRKIAMWLGVLSFPVYALHQPLYSIADVIFSYCVSGQQSLSSIFAIVFTSLASMQTRSVDRLLSGTARVVSA